MFWLRGWDIGGVGGGVGADNISLTILIISPAGITCRQIIGIILVNLDWRYIQNVLTVLISEDLSFKKLIVATLSPLGISRNSMWHLRWLPKICQLRI